MILKWFSPSVRTWAKHLFLAFGQDLSRDYGFNCFHSGDSLQSGPMLRELKGQFSALRSPETISRFQESTTGHKTVKCCVHPAFVPIVDNSLKGMSPVTWSICSAIGFMEFPEW